MEVKKEETLSRQTAKQVEDVLGVFANCSGSQEILSKCWHWSHTDAPKCAAGQTGNWETETSLQTHLTHMCVCGLQRVFPTVFSKVVAKLKFVYRGSQSKIATRFLN